MCWMGWWSEPHPLPPSDDGVYYVVCGFSGDAELDTL